MNGSSAHKDRDDDEPGKPGSIRRGGLSAGAAEDLGARVAAYREWHCLTQADLASLAGFSRYTVNNIESGRGASKSTRRKLAATFGVSPASLLDPRVPWQEPGLLATEEESSGSQAL